MPTRLSLYNAALRICGDARLASLTENREPRHLLDDVWDNGALKYCLEQGNWNFATRTVRVEATTAISPDFGFKLAFVKPSDWVRTSGFASDQYFRAPMTDRSYKDEGGYWWADIDPVFVRYVSDDEDFGLDMALWPETFTRFVEHYLATQIIPRLKEAKISRDDVGLLYKRARTDALSKDAMNEGASFPPAGGWANARQAGRGNRWRG